MSWGNFKTIMKSYMGNQNGIKSKEDFAKQFTHAKNFEFIHVNLDQKIKDLKLDIMNKLKGKIDGTEVALSIASGDGKEHMALISALINSPVGIRFAALTKEGVIDL